MWVTGEGGRLRRGGWRWARGKDAMDAQGLIMDEAATVEAGSETEFLVSYEGDIKQDQPKPKSRRIVYLTLGVAGIVHPSGHAVLRSASGG
jgi:hypothetical protein